MNAAAPESLVERGLALHAQGRLAEAGVHYQRALELDPGHSRALYLLAALCIQSQQLDRALELLRRAVEVDPQSVTARVGLGDALYLAGRYEAALSEYQSAVALDPANAPALNSRGSALQALRRYDAAISDFEKAIALRADFALAHYNRGNALRELRRYEDALASYEKALAINPQNPDIFNNRGISYDALGQYEAAVRDYECAIALAPNHALAHYNLANSLQALSRYDQAVASYDRATALQPRYAEAWLNRGSALVRLGQFTAAVASYDKAIALQPLNAEAHCNRGKALQLSGQYAPALLSLEQAIALVPNLADAHCHRGQALQALARYEEAIGSYQKAIACGSSYDGLEGLHLFARLQICDWEGIHSERSRLIAQLEAAESADAVQRVSPYDLMFISDSAQLQRKVAEQWVRSQRLCDRTRPIEAHPAHGRIRIGYFSADFRNHPVSLLTAELFEIHDRSRFETIAFSLGPDGADPVRRRMEKAFDHFIDLREGSDADISRRAREMKLDIAVDLGGYTQGSRPRIFARRAAPLQVSYLGYPGTLGADYIDYLIADRMVIPVDSQRHYSEKIIYMPDTYLVHDSTRSIADVALTREQLGLPSTGCVFCCFNGSRKITPDTFDCWMRILQRTEQSVLWLIADNPSAVRNLSREAVRRGVSAERVRFAARVPRMEVHLSRYRAADLFLDTLPYNGHTTACDALWAGLPVLTCTGSAFAARVAASLLSAIGLPELITTSCAEYEELAVRLAHDPARLSAIRSGLAAQRLTAPLFDTRRFARKLEAAYLEIYTRLQAGMPTDHVYVD